MKSFALSALFIISFLGCGAIAAKLNEANERRFPISIAAVEQRTAQRIGSMDTNGDNVIDAAEFEAAESPAARTRFKRSGQRGQGQRPKFGRRGHPARHAAYSQAVQAEVFTILDEDGDGSISADEFQSADRKATHKLARKRAMFKRLDADGDGILNRAEMPDPAKRLRAADADGNGEVTAREFRNHRQRSG